MANDSEKSIQKQHMDEVIQIRMDALAGLVACREIYETLEKSIPRVQEFASENERIGEYDASAKAIIELSNIVKHMMLNQMMICRTLVQLGISVR
jgi:hypothetical protein